MMADSMTTLELHYVMLQFFNKIIYCFREVRSLKLCLKEKKRQETTEDYKGKQANIAAKVIGNTPQTLEKGISVSKGKLLVLDLGLKL